MDASAPTDMGLLQQEIMELRSCLVGVQGGVAMMQQSAAALDREVPPQQPGLTSTLALASPN